MSSSTKVPDDWYVGFHDGLAAEFWRAAGAAMADGDVRVVERLIGDAERVLDVPCGDGRLTVRLAASGRGRGAAPRASSSATWRRSPTSARSTP